MQEKKFIQNIAILTLSLMYVFPFRHNWCLHIHSDRKNNSPPIAHFRFSNDVKGEQKYKKERWQCSQNFILNPTRVNGF